MNTSRDASDGQLAASARAVATVAQRAKAGVGFLSGAAAGAAVFIWVLVWWPPRMDVLPVLGAGATLVGLLLPSAVLGLCYQGLHDLLELPRRISDRATRTVNESAQAVETVNSQDGSGLLGRVWRLLKHIWALRSMLSEHRALFIRYGTLIRFLTPGFLGLAGIAVFASIVLIVVGIGLGLLTLGWWGMLHLL